MKRLFRTAPKASKATSRRAFTVVELLVATIILAVLASLGFSLVGGMRQKTLLTKELNAGKSLMTAYLLAAAENNGRFLPGDDESATRVWSAANNAWIEATGVLQRQIVRRYPFRLAPYMSHRLEGTILVNENLEAVKNSSPGMRDYLTSTAPSFGINYLLVGGHVHRHGTVAMEHECITHSSRSRGSVLAFATAAAGIPGSSYRLAGYSKILSPQNGSWLNREWSTTSDPVDFGFVDARHNGKALCAFLDGSVRAHTIDELRDMRLWSFRAAETNDPTYFPSSTPKN